MYSLETEKASITSPGTINALSSEYEEWLETQPFSEHTKRNYRSKVRYFLGFVEALPACDGPDALLDPARYPLLVASYSAFLRDSLLSRMSTVNNCLTAIDNFYAFLGLCAHSVKREKVARENMRVMSQEDNSKLQQVLVSSASGKERAIVAIFLETGIRLSECAALNVCDLAISDSLGKLNIYNKRNSSCREVQLNEAARAPLQAWLKERNDRFALSEKSALFVNYLGERISTAGLDFLIRKIGIRARMNLSAQILRDTCLATLARNSKDPFLVAEIGGFKQLDSSRKYFGLVFP